MIEQLGGSGPSLYPWSGPGSKLLEQGTLLSGFFDSVNESELFSARDLALRAGFQASSATTSKITWWKFFYRGKVVYVPDRPIVGGITFKQLYEQGIVYGPNEEIPDTAMAFLEQRAMDQHRQGLVLFTNGRQFIVRLLGITKDTEDGPVVKTGSIEESSIATMSEYTALMLRTSGQAKAIDGVSKFKIKSGYLNLAGYSYPLKDMDSSGYRATYGSDINAITLYNSVTVQMQWMPVLELVPLGEGYLIANEWESYNTDYYGGYGHSLQAVVERPPEIRHFDLTHEVPDTNKIARPHSLAIGVGESLAYPHSLEAIVEDAMEFSTITVEHQVDLTLHVARPYGLTIDAGETLVYPHSLKTDIAKVGEVRTFTAVPEYIELITRPSHILMDSFNSYPHSLTIESNNYMDIINFKLQVE